MGPDARSWSVESLISSLSQCKLFMHMVQRNGPAKRRTSFLGCSLSNFISDKGLVNDWRVGESTPNNDQSNLLGTQHLPTLAQTPLRPRRRCAAENSRTCRDLIMCQD